MKKYVSFNERRNEVKILVVWDFAYWNARKSDWKILYLDKLRFKKRIEDCEVVISKIFTDKHRMLIYNERFAVKN